MKRIESRLNTASAEFQANAAHNGRLAAAFREKQRAVREDRPQRDIDRLRQQDKLLVRERLQRLLDPGTPFLELSSLAANEAYGGEVPGAGCVSGIGIVSGREVVISATRPAASCRCRPICSPTSTTPAASSGTSASCRRWACSRCRWCSATAPPVAPMCRRCRTTTSSSAAPVPSSWPGRRW
jgi:ribosomal protein L40E